MKYRKTYKFAFYSSIALSFFVFLILIISNYLFKNENFSYWYLLFFVLIFIIFSFLLIQYRVEKFIYKRIQKIYKDVSILDIENLAKNSITSNMETLSKNVQLFAENKRLEIEILTERENYRKEFLGNISHELKTPLFTVQGYILTLLEGAINDKEIRLKYLERANNGVERLNHIVKDLDLISKLETGDLNLKITHFDILDLVREVFELLDMKAKKRTINLLFDKVYEGKIFVKADRDRIEQVLLNLISNAINYSKNKGFTKLSIQAYQKDKVIVQVIDNGVGITKENQLRIFERFYRADKSRSRNQGGSGLGLSIVKHIIEAHNEDVFVESEIGKGSIFSFTLQQL
ncbi:MAG: ATP-binding protein [Flavobacteriaceae bacterium]|nr:ATP-binding protein [Flavobacteriaceae bacterium]